MKKLLLLIAFVFISVLPLQTKAQDASWQDPTIAKARIIEIVSEGTQDVNPFGDQPGQSPKYIPTQDIKAVILDGKDAGKIIRLTNDHALLEVGDKFYATENIQPDGTIRYFFSAPYRIDAIMVFLLIFIGLVWLFGGIQGLRGLVSLAGSLLLIIFVLIPSILNGFSPFIASFGIAGLIIVIGSYITHGFNKTTTVAVVSMMSTVIVTGIFTHYAISSTHLTGLEENAMYLNFNSAVDIDLVGLLFGGIMIGLLGVLYDVAISQAIAVEELHKAAPHLPRWTIYKRAIRMGKEHIGALVDTLAIAYVGVSLPLILLYSRAGLPFLATINQEIFATEIIRILVSSSGVVLAVPITTLLAAYILIEKQEGGTTKEIIEKEEEKIKQFGHVH